MIHLFPNSNGEPDHDTPIAEENWIAGAIKHPGALHADLGVPQGKKIPHAMIVAATHSDNPTIRRRANLALTLKRIGRRSRMRKRRGEQQGASFPGED